MEKATFISDIIFETDYDEDYEDDYGSIYFSSLAIDHEGNLLTIDNRNEKLYQLKLENSTDKYQISKMFGRKTQPNDVIDDKIKYISQYPIHDNMIMKNNKYGEILLCDKRGAGQLATITFFKWDSNVDDYYVTNIIDNIDTDFIDCIDIDNLGNIYICSAGESMISVLHWDENTKTYTQNLIFRNENNIEENLNNPLGIVVNDKGRIYISDSASNTIKYLEYDNELDRYVLITIAGSGEPGDRDGIDTESNFNFPMRVDIDKNDPDEKIYVTDEPNGKVKCIQWNYKHNLYETYTIFDGTDEEEYPRDMIIDRYGNIYVTSKNKIIKLTRTSSGPKSAVY